MIIYSGDLQEDYLHWAKKALNHAEIPLEKLIDATTAVEFVRAGMRARATARKNAIHYEVWCIVDSFADLEPARRLAAENHIRLVASTPAFPAWLLLHFEDPTTVDDDTLLERLEQYLPEMSTRSPSCLDPLAGNYGDAAGRARAALHGEITSEMYELVDVIRESLQEYLDVEECPGL